MTALGRESDGWVVGETFALALRMQAVTLEVIMRGVFGIDGSGGRGSSSRAEHRMRETIRRLLAASTTPLYQLVELRNAGSREPRDLLAAMLRIVDRLRVRPVIPKTPRMVTRPWRLGEYVLPAGTPVAVSILGRHHRDDVHPRPQEFAPERLLERKPGTNTWIPFCGGIRRCLGATLAMAEQRVVALS